ncbi:MAG: hypothetical protein Q8O01_06590, partial [Candidatus Omnitrophota bacterium]|nr:hypothetical protein [Candidatus Omnitrophota bacterium]
DLGWAGTGFSYDNQSTTLVETFDFSLITYINLGLKGSASKVKVEFVDKDGNKAVTYLNSIDSSAEKVWSIPTAILSGVDLANIRFIYFIVEGNNQAGTLIINRLPDYTVIMPSSTATQADINIPVVNLTDPSPTSLAPTGSTASVAQSDRGLTLTYDTATGGWAGAGFSYDIGDTTAKEYYNFSSLTQITLGVKGSSERVKLEFVDINENKSYTYLYGVSSAEERFFVVPFNQLTGNVDMTKVMAVYVIVEGNNRTGTVELSYLKGSVYIYPSATLTQADISMPNATLYDPSIMGVSINPLNSAVSLTPRGLHDVYSTGTDGWAGAGFSYDDFFTETIKEYKDLSGVVQMVFGIKGTSSQLKVEFIDKDGNKSAIYLAGISSTTEQFYAIQLSSLIGNAKLSEISYINFIVEGVSLTGSFDINRFADQVTINPSTNVKLSDINLPFDGSDYPYITTVAPTGATANTVTTPRGLSFEYDTEDLGWAGTGFSYDNQSTTLVETFDFSLITYINLGLKGSASKVKVEFV